MIRISILAASTLLALPAFAGGSCSEPYAPAIHDGATATKQQLVAMREDVVAYMTAADIYQACLAKAAKEGRESDLTVTATIDSNQKEKTRVGSEFNTAVAAFKAHNAEN